jgi:hypothetical protein
VPASTRSDAPAPLVVAAAVAALEGLLTAGFAVLELASLTSGRLTMGLTTAAFFAAYGALLMFCGWQLTRLAGWARSPVLLSQLIQLGMAWSFRDGDTLPVAIGLAVLAAVVLAGLFHPASMKALDH